MPDITIHSFHPFNVDLPKCDVLEGKVRLILPEVHVQVFDLSMGIQALKGAHLGADVQMVCFEIDLPESIEIGKFMEFLVKSRDEFEKVWELTQEKINEHGAMLGGGE